MFNTSTICILISVVVYLLGMLAIGIMYSKNSTTEDFYLGGRKLGPIVTAMSTEASDMSAYLLMGVPGLAFFCGVAEAGWTAIGLALGTYLNWLIVAKRMRQYSAKTHSITVPDFLAVRFRRRDMRLAGYTSAVPLCMTFFQQVRKLIAVFRVNGHFECMAVLPRFLGRPAFCITSGTLRCIGGDFLLDRGCCLFHSRFHGCIRKVCIFRQTAHDLVRHIVNRSHPAHQPFVYLP